MFKSVFSPIKLNQLEIRNRLVVPPMVTNYGNERGEVTDRHIAYLEERAKGGFGLIVLEATAVHPSGIGFPKGIGLWNDGQMDGLSRLAAAVHAKGAKLAVQLYHAGRQTYSAVLGGQSVSASPVPCPVCSEVPRELTRKDIAELVKAFARAAERAKEAGADAVEIHGAHGYLIGQFTSPYSNRRVDAYGGALHNRLRFALEVIASVRRSTGAEFPIIYRISIRERVPGGLTPVESLPIVKVLEEAGVDAFHVSTGVYGSMPYIIPNFYLPDGLNMDDAAMVREHVGVPVIVAGKITEILTAESVISGGNADMVAMGRASIVDPELPKKSAAGALDDVRPCITCNQGCSGGLNGPEQAMSCLVNPAVGKEREYRFEPATVKKNCLVVGGGPAGLEVARILAQRGHHVVLSERDDRFGGQFRVAALPPEKQPLAKLIRWQVDQAAKAGVTLKLGEEVTRQSIAETKPDVVVVATGGRPATFGIPGADGPWVVPASLLLTGKRIAGNSVLVLGGGSVGCEVADYLLSLQKKVTIVELLDELAKDAESSQRFFLLQRLKEGAVETYLKARIVEVLPDGAVCDRGGQVLELRGYDTVVSALGYVPDDRLLANMPDGVTEVYVVGDAKTPGDALQAIRDAEQLAMGI